MLVRMVGMLNLSGIFSLNLSEMAIVGFYHRTIIGVELVRNFLPEFVRNLLGMVENVRNFFMHQKGANSQKMSKIRLEVVQI